MKHFDCNSWGGTSVEIPDDLPKVSVLDYPTRPTRSPVKLSYGLGVDSTAIIVEYVRRGWPIDAILFADTGSEKPGTYAYLAVINAYLAANGYPQVTVVKNASPKAGDTSLHGECLRKSVLPSPAYGGKSCSLKWKVEPQRKWMHKWDQARAAWAHGILVENLIGFEASPNEMKRTARGRDKWPPGHLNRYPLQEWGWDRARCEIEIAAAGLPVPPKSACFMCPASKKHEIDALAVTSPELVDVCRDLERRAHERGLTTVKGLGRRFSWTEYLAEARGGCSGAPRSDHP